MRSNGGPHNGCFVPVRGRRRDYTRIADVRALFVVLPTSADGHSPRLRAASPSKTFSASGSNGSYSRCFTRRTLCVLRATPTNVHTSPQPHRHDERHRELRRQPSTANGSLVSGIGAPHFAI